jgi:hypothetical protein
MTATTRRAATAGQGRLAEVIALRGGKAAAEAPFVIEHREALIYREVAPAAILGQVGNQKREEMS